jgi:hypothetical protein
MRNYYQDFKNLYDSVKPIRGRAEDTRPIGARRKDWELVEMDGDVVACRLYKTQCVRYYPDGRIGLQADGWHSVTTAEFIHTHSPWQCFKRNNKLWVIVASETDKYLHYPIPKKGELQFEIRDGRWQPVGEVLIEKRVVNREKSKAARAPYRAFMSWAKVFMKMSDGWLMHETRKQVIALKVGDLKVEDRVGFTYEWRTDIELLDAAREGNEDKFLKVLFHILSQRRDAIETRVAESLPYSYEFMGQIRNYVEEFHDMQFRFEFLRGRVDRMIKNFLDVYETVRVEATTRTQSGII